MDAVSIKEKTLNMIDELKAVCGTYGLGGSPSEYKIITQNGRNKSNSVP